MENSIIPLEKCKNTILLAKQIYNDQKFGDGPRRFGDYGKENIRLILKSTANREYITAKQKNELENIVKNYQKIVALNSSYEEGLRESTIKLLEEIADLANIYSRQNENIKKRKGYMMLRINQIKRGRYFWHTHFWPGYFVLQDLQGMGVETGDLSERVSKLMERTSVLNLWGNKI